MIRTLVVLMIGSAWLSAGAAAQDAAKAPAAAAAKPAPAAPPASAAAALTPAKSSSSPSVEALPELPAQHTVVPTDTMWDLAKRYYGDHFKWRVIAEANPAPKVKDPHWIYPGQILIIPALAAKAEAPAPVPAPEPEVMAEAPAPPEPQPVPEVAEEPPAPKPSGLEELTESLSRKIPEGAVSGYPSTPRLKAPADWKEDGKVVTSDQAEIVAAAGETISVEIEGKPTQGARYTIYRKATATDADKDLSATYLVRVGTVEIRRPHKKTIYRARVVSSSDPIEIGDLLKKE
ncbi:MAG: LysM peptidoglycan-binding domain-containing protein [Elusimicrobia bacterium]|nr:LysM peptidoglycan-binding domain-containing protein [Elusimicrobiota bacterium]